MPLTTDSTLPVRGVHVDCRAQRLTLPAMLGVLEDLARMGFNAVLLEYYDRFPYRGRARKATAPDALTRSEIRNLLKTARGLGLQVIPLIQSLGHLPWLLRLPEFASMREAAGVSESTVDRAMHSICPSHRRTMPLLRDMFAEVLDLHPDCRYIHMGGDEAGIDPHCPRCGPRLTSQGPARIYMEHFCSIARWLREQGPDPILWSDMVLAYPSTLDALREHVIVMDWDYWSLPGKNPRCIVRGVPQKDWLHPSRWPTEHRTLLADYIFDETGRARPYPTVRFLRDRGCRVMTAPAARSADDSFAVPKSFLVDNVIGSAQEARDAHALGCTITSWALRRSPWPITEYALLAGAMTLADPPASRRAIDERFAREHFGRADATLAKIPQLLGRESLFMAVFAAQPGMDPDSGHWFSLPYERRIERINADRPAFKKALRNQRKNLDAARKLLALARPTSTRQKQRTTFWRWAADVLEHCCDVAEQMLLEPGRHEPAEIRKLIRRADQLDRRTEKLLHPWYTPRTIQEEQQARFGSQIDWLESLLEAPPAQTTS